MTVRNDALIASFASIHRLTTWRPNAAWADFSTQTHSEAFAHQQCLLTNISSVKPCLTIAFEMTAMKVYCGDAWVRVASQAAGQLVGSLS